MKHYDALSHGQRPLRHFKPMRVVREHPPMANPEDRPFLLTGFERFGQWPLNPSELLVRHFADQTFGANKRLHCEVLPTVYETAGARIRELIRDIRPALVLSLGLSGSRPKICLERFALNIDDVAVADNASIVRAGEAIDPAGPAALKTGADLHDLLKRLLAAGVDAEISNHAGTYVCNHVFYQLLRQLQIQAEPAIGLFVHLPIIEEACAGSDATQSRWRLADLIAAVDLIIDSLLKQSARQLTSAH